uniref:Uncharacterized protein n=2 Tax=Gossypium raimondii TaxID=29730 RepID=A0A0D2TXB8_GOSRA|nr:hypothetical protein B456_013G079700 [Gossypium raimondii]
MILPCLCRLNSLNPHILLLDSIGAGWMKCNGFVALLCDDTGSFMRGVTGNANTFLEPHVVEEERRYPSSKIQE